MPPPLPLDRTRNVRFPTNTDRFITPSVRAGFHDIDQLMCQSFGWTAAQKFQVEGAILQLARRDTIIHAGTGKGKTAVAAAPYVLDENHQKLTIMVSPLLALQEDMEGSFGRKFHIPAIALNSLLNTAQFSQKIKDILARRYRVILISPECLLSHHVRDALLTNDTFKKQVFSIVIDEAHVIAYWGANFRKIYATLHIVRNYLPGVPVICLSATLTPRIIRHISLNLDMKDGEFAMINEGNERPDLSLGVRTFSHPASSYIDLLFPLIPPLAPDVLRYASDIPQAYVFFNSKNEVQQALRVVNSFVPPHLGSLGLFRPFTARHSPQYRAEVMRRFKAGDVRWLLGTEAVGMGCDVSKIYLAIQWGLVSLSVLIQHWGRVREAGLAVMLVPPAARNYNPTEPGVLSQATTSKSKSKRQKTEPLKKGGWRSDIPGDQPEIREDSPYEGTLALVQTNGCLRKIWTQVFDNEPIEPTVAECCTNCSKPLADRIKAPKRTRTRRSRKIEKPERGCPHRPTQEALVTWRTNVWARDYPGVSWGASVILSDEFVDSLSSVGCILERETLQFLLEGWGWWEAYGKELERVVYALDIPFAPVPPTAPQTSKRKAASSKSKTTAGASTSAGPNTQARAAKRARPAASSKPEETIVHDTRFARRTQQQKSKPPVSLSNTALSRPPLPPRVWTPPVYPLPPNLPPPPRRVPIRESKPTS
ncbi:hypothetical protein FRC09_001792 [Ceratobasidium sp. 395]|nr:hypothetical protein FRC09_001792 [Ceratobasidium sp. 395]